MSIPASQPAQDARGAAVPAALPHCVVITRFAADQPGFLDFSYRLNALATRFRLTVVSNFPLTQSELHVPGAEYIVFDASERRLDWMRYLWRCARLVRRRRPAVAVLLHSTVAPMTLLCGATPTALYWNEHPTHFAPAPDGFAPLRRMLRAAMRTVLFSGARNASVVMPIGEAHHRDLVANGCVARRTQLIHMGVDAAFSGVAPRAAPPMPAPAQPLALIYVGSVSRARGRDVMLEALAQANRHGTVAQLTIVGAAPAEQVYCAARARHLGIAAQLTVLGRVDGAAIPALLGAADAGLCLWEDRPWWRFNPPTKLFEYLVAGLPVLASDIETHTRYIQNWRNGLIFSYGSTALAQAIESLWQRHAELPLLKQQARLCGRQYVWQRLQPAFLAAIDAVAKP